MKSKRFLKLMPTLILLTVYLGMALVYDDFSPLDLLIYLGIAAAAIGIGCIPFRFKKLPAVIIALLLPAAAFFLMESMTHVVFTTMEIDAVALNLIFFYLAFMFLFFITGTSRRALLILLIFANIVGIANYFVILFRSSPILPWDLLSLGTAMTVANNYTFSVTWELAWLSAAFLAVINLACRSDFSLRSFGLHRMAALAVRIVCCLILIIPSAVYINFLFQPDIAENTSLDNTLFTPKYMFRTNGFFVAFIMDMRYLQISEPDGYSAELAENILSEYESGSTPAASSDNPNIIVIMNECFSDLSAIADFDVNEDYMPFVRSLLDGAENTISGELYSSVLGGNTANSEFEYLTGNTMAFLPAGSIPYQQYLRSYCVSSVQQLKELGYSADALHPYNAAGWNRLTVYNLMGFDNFYSLKNFKHREQIRKYICDEADYQEVLSVLDSAAKPSFIFNVTMQNHSGYGTAYDNFTPDITTQLKKAKTNTYLTNYLSLIKLSDKAIEDFLTELSARDDKTIVVFFGDHQPNDYVVEPIYRENDMDINNQTLEQQQNRQKVPFFIWANYDIPEESGLSMSINYLNARVLETAGLQLTPYQNFLMAMNKEIPVIDAVGIISSDGEYSYLNQASDSQQEWIDKYRILQYYFLFDQK